MQRNQYHGPFTLPLPPTEPQALVPWLRTAAAALNGQMPVLKSFHTNLRMRVGVVDDDEDRALAEVVGSVIQLLDDEDLITGARVSDLDAKWDRCVPAGQILVSVRSALPPRHRIGRETRAKISAACRRSAKLEVAA